LYNAIFVFLRNGSHPTIGIAIGDQILDLAVITKASLFKGPHLNGSSVFLHHTLNAFMGLGKPAWSEARKTITQLLSVEDPTLRDNTELRHQALVPQAGTQMIMPCHVGDYTDFYSSKEHASNVGIMFRGKDNALQPNWLWIPIGYHGRSSSIVVSGTSLRRPKGQLRVGENPPTLAPSKELDFELEMAFFVGPGNKLGEPIKLQNSEEHIFGITLMNDWSARDIQRWEYVPLGPFGAKNFGTTISPWIVTLEALEQFKVQGPVQEPQPLEYLLDPTRATYDINLEVHYKTAKSEKSEIISRTNLKYMYWNLRQQITHHTITGCNMQPGDLLGTGTISGANRENWGSLLEIGWKGTTPLSLASGETRVFIEDGDTLTIIGYAQGSHYRIGFGKCEGTILPAV